MSPTTTPASQYPTAKTAWINGARPQYQSLRVTVQDGRAYIGAKGWSRAHQAGDAVNLELDLIGLQNLMVTAREAIDLILATPTPPAVQPATEPDAEAAKAA